MCNSGADDDQAMRFEKLTHGSYCLQLEHAVYFAVLHLCATGNENFFLLQLLHKSTDFEY